MKTIARTGLTVGIIIGAVCVLIFAAMSRMIDAEFEILNPASIMIVSIVVNIVGAHLYNKLYQMTDRPVLLYGLIAFGIAIALSLLDRAYPPEPMVADVAIPIHMTVATLSTALMPGWTRRQHLCA